MLAPALPIVFLGEVEPEDKGTQNKCWIILGGVGWANKQTRASLDGDESFQMGMEFWKMLKIGPRNLFDPCVSYDYSISYQCKRDCPPWPTIHWNVGNGSNGIPYCPMDLHPPPFSEGLDR